MYADFPQTNQLTALLQAHGIADVVACPGSRNAPLLHDFEQAGLCLHAVTDERSAAFVALGIGLATEKATAVCVTSGSALLATLPAVAEAYYRHRPLLVISADRPAQWTGQYDGQTLPQRGALKPYAPTFDLFEPHTPELHWANNRLINAALLALHEAGGGPAHLNVPLSEPLFGFNTEVLPPERVVSRITPAVHSPLPEELVQQIAEARLPALVVGQYDEGDLRAVAEALDRQEQLLVLPEILADISGSLRMEVFDNLPDDRPELMPDLVLHAGGNFVHKRFKQRLRRSGCKVIRLSLDRELTDTFCHLDTEVTCAPLPALQQLAAGLPSHHDGVKRARVFYEQACLRYRQPVPSTESGMMQAFGALRTVLHETSAGYTLHLGNSSTVRVASRILESGDFPIFANRGTNGIEGSLSTAVGYALKMWGPSIVVLGDLSFFYDANALWNTHLPPNLRILLLNNHGGGIFHQLPGLEASPAMGEFISAGGQPYTAEGLARTFGLGYHCVASVEDLVPAMRQWLQTEGRAQLLEVALPPCP